MLWGRNKRERKRDGRRKEGGGVGGVGGVHCRGTEREHQTDQGLESEYLDLDQCINFSYLHSIAELKHFLGH